MKYFFYCLGLLLATTPAYAHVAYVMEPEQFVEGGGVEASFLLAALTPFNSFLILTTILLFVAVNIYIWPKPFVKKINERLQNIAKEYKEYLPLLLRMGLAMVFIGAAGGNYLVSPIGYTTSAIATVQLALGFALMFGLGSLFASILAILVYVYALASNIYYIGNIEVLAMVLAYLVLANNKPGIDHFFGFSMPEFKVGDYMPTFILRIGVGFALMFSALYEKFFYTAATSSIVFDFHLMEIIPVSASMWVFSALVIEFCLGLFLFIGWRTRFMSVVAFLMLMTTLFFFGESVFSHVSLFIILFWLFIAGGGPKSVDARLKA